MSMKITRHEFVYGLDCDQAANEITRLRQLEQDGTRWHDLFGTPEKAARTLRGFCEQCRYGDCVECGVPEWADYTHDYDELLEWLEGAER